MTAAAAGTGEVEGRRAAAAAAEAVQESALLPYSLRLYSYIIDRRHA